MTTSVDHLRNLPDVSWKDDDEREVTAMTDREHRRLFGWGWDDPEDEA